MYDSASFRAEARFQQLCVVCGRPRPFHAHHVVYEQHVVAIDARLRWHPDNSARVCIQDCHFGHHQRRSVIDVARLRDENLEFAVRLMGTGPTIVYFQRYYADEGGVLIPRIEQLEVAA